MDYKKMLDEIRSRRHRGPKQHFQNEKELKSYGETNPAFPDHDDVEKHDIEMNPVVKEYMSSFSDIICGGDHQPSLVYNQSQYDSDSKSEKTYTDMNPLPKKISKTFTLGDTIFGGKQKDSLNAESLQYERDIIGVFNFLVFDEGMPVHKKRTGELRDLSYCIDLPTSREGVSDVIENLIAKFTKDQFPSLLDECESELRTFEDKENANLKDGEFPIDSCARLWKILFKILNTPPDKSVSSTAPQQFASSEHVDTCQQSEACSPSNFGSLSAIDVLLKCLVDPGTYDFGGPIGEIAEKFNMWVFIAVYKPLLLLHRFETPDFFFEYVWKLRKEQGFCFTHLFAGIFSKGWSPAMLLSNVESTLLTAFERALFGFVHIDSLSIAFPLVANKTEVNNAVQSWAVCKGISVSDIRWIQDYDLIDIYYAVVLLSRSWRSPILWNFQDVCGFDVIDTKTANTIKEKSMSKAEDGGTPRPWVLWNESFFETLAMLEKYLRLLMARLTQLSGSLIYGGIQVDLRLVKHKEYYMYITNQITWFLGLISMLEHKRTLVDKKKVSLPSVLCSIYQRKTKDVINKNMFWERCLATIETFRTETTDFCKFSASFGELDDELTNLWEGITDPIDMKNLFLTRNGGSIGTSDTIARRNTQTHAQDTNKFEMLKFREGSTDCLNKMISHPKKWIPNAVCSLIGVKLCYTRFVSTFSWIKEMFLIDKDIASIVQKKFTNMPDCDKRANSEQPTPDKKSVGSFLYSPFLRPDILLLSNDERQKLVDRKLLSWPTYIFESKPDQDEKAPKILLAGCMYVLISKYVFFVSPILAEVFMVWGAVMDVYHDWTTTFDITFVGMDKTTQTRTQTCLLNDGTKFALGIGEFLHRNEMEATGDTSEAAQRKAKIIESTQKKIDTSRRGTKKLSESEIYGSSSTPGNSKDTHIENGTPSSGNPGWGRLWGNRTQDKI